MRRGRGGDDNAAGAASGCGEAIGLVVSAASGMKASSRAELELLSNLEGNVHVVAFWEEA